jgi:2-polyprenyl-3-methyl-5-hydroxy-6-metoxy-1,4-benzoquinol methylase
MRPVRARATAPNAVKKPPEVADMGDERTTMGKAATMFVTGHAEKTADYYSDIYKRGYNTAGYLPLYKAVMQMIGRCRNPRVLELGCGIGDLGRMIIEAGYPYRGFDFSPEAIGQCRRACPQGCFRVGNVYNRDDFLPYDYNLVVALEVLEHVDDLRVMAMIPAGARVIASVPDYDDVAHLRLYRDVQKDIIDYFAPCVHVGEVVTATARNTATGAEQKIHLFQGIRLLT